jgi:hypothetical protein
MRMKRSKLSRFPLRTPPKFLALLLRKTPMLRLLKFLLRRPPVRMGRVDNARIRRTTIRNAQFVSFVDASGCLSTRNPDRHDRKLLRQKLMRVVVALAAASGLGWVVLESARAISQF